MFRLHYLVADPLLKGLFYGHISNFSGSILIIIASTTMILWKV